MVASAGPRRWPLRHPRPRRLALGHFIAELACDERRRVAVDELVDAREDAALDQLADHVRGVDRELGRKLLDGDRGGQLDRAALARVQDLDRRRGGLAAAVACADPDGCACRSYFWPISSPSLIVFIVVSPPPRRARLARQRGAGARVIGQGPCDRLSATHRRRHRYAPRPGARPDGSGSTSPAGDRTTRSRSRFGRIVRHATQVRSGHAAGRRPTARL